MFYFLNITIEPSPFTWYPFFNRSFSISNFISCKLDPSISVKVLLVCNAAKGFPGCPLGLKAASPYFPQSLNQWQIMLLSALYSFSSVRTEICSFKCLPMISNFCSFVHIRLFCPFFILIPPDTFQHKKKVDTWWFSMCLPLFYYCTQPMVLILCCLCYQPHKPFPIVTAVCTVLLEIPKTFAAARTIEPVSIIYFPSSSARLSVISLIQLNSGSISLPLTV